MEFMKEATFWRKRHTHNMSRYDPYSVRREATRVFDRAHTAFFSLLGKTVRLRPIRDYWWVMRTRDIIENHNFIGIITNASPHTGELQVRFGNGAGNWYDSCIVWVARSEIKLLE